MLVGGETAEGAAEIMHEASIPQRLPYSLPVYVSLEQQIADRGKWKLLNRGTRMWNAFEAVRVCAINQLSAQLIDSDTTTENETHPLAQQLPRRKGICGRGHGYGHGHGHGHGH
jgi:hypothetical protein